MLLGKTDSDANTKVYALVLSDSAALSVAGVGMTHRFYDYNRFKGHGVSYGGFGTDSNQQ